MLIRQSWMLLGTLACGLTAASAGAQVGAPIRYTTAEAPPEAPAALLARPEDARAWTHEMVFETGSINRAVLARQDADLDKIPGMPSRIGVVHEAAANSQPMMLGGAWGQWTPLPGGANIWRARLRSSDALRVRLHIVGLRLPPGGSLTIQGTSDGPAWNAINAKDLTADEATGFWTPSLFGDTVNIEYLSPSTATVGPLGVITQVAHIYRDGALQAQKATGSGDDSSSCNLNALCESRTTGLRDGVARIELIDSGQAYLCSGAFLNDNDATSETPWFLTANHCVPNQAVALTVEAFLKYTARSCDDSTAVSLGSVATMKGADFIAGASDVDGPDTTLIRFKTAAPKGTALLGWSLTRPTPTASGQSGKVMWIHHPHGSFQRVTFGDIVAAPSPRCEDTPESDYLYTRQARGTTEPGSSGSPLFDEGGNVVGVLSALCGNSDNACQPSQFTVIFGFFGKAYAQLNLSSILQPQADDQYEQNDTIAKAAKLPSAGGTFSLQLLDAFDFFAITVDRIAILDVHATLQNPGAALKMKVLLGKLNVSGTIGPVQEAEAHFRVRPGRYIIEIDRSGATGGPYQLDLAYSSASDVNTDGKVDLTDLIDVLNNWGDKCRAVTADCPDINGDGLVNTLDLKQVLLEYGYVRKQYSAKAWNEAMTSLYNDTILPAEDTRTPKQKINDLLRLKGIKP